MPLEDFIITVFCWVDEHLNALLGDHCLRSRGFAPKLNDSEVITMEVVGEFLGLDTDVGIWKYFGRHWPSWFPELGSRTTFAQQAANLWVIKQRLHQQLLIELGAATDPIRLVDGCPLPLCVLTRAPHCRLFPAVADFGYCAAKKQYYYGLHGHLMVTIHGVITAWTVTPATGDEREALWDLTEGVQGWVIGDKGYLSAFLQTELATTGIDLQTPLRANMIDPRPPWAVQQLTRTRRLVETVIGQLTEPFHFEKIRARDVWHLTSRIARKVLAHTLGIFMNRQVGRSDLQFEGLIA
ncbi:MAG: IS982 family transposase [Gammaproteobacteria bacterium]|nr:IS982 family transposase [Gammaproteobacteria bacterium]MCP5125772.1 IS982 family transposase [Gammaproteobacteria bacterium]MCP5126425.1 IS982 family transposase [Gammaproteobacteria bacterium]MCP5127028.1 IS982 family transposase [Gammaproteobacteria bacterium]MCP5127731.1 IS982 family transposase [Gammaproteobacteria bacterium]